LRVVVVDFAGGNAPATANRRANPKGLLRTHEMIRSPPPSSQPSRWPPAAGLSLNPWYRIEGQVTA
jgi:hypothetical protein